MAVLLGTGALAFTTISASAAIVCNEDGDCWHVKEKYDHPPKVKLTIHEDNWKWGDADHYRWREHDGRGYWQGGVWLDISFRRA